jgi:type VI secretion system protein ImpH
VSFRDDLMKEPWRFDFFTVMRRFERHHEDRPRIGRAAARRDEYVVLGEDPYLEFAASNLSKVDLDAQGRVRVLSRFLGLLGPQGALPLSTTEETFHWHLERDDAFARFLDILNHRFLQLFYRAWADARPIVQHDRPDDDRFLTYLGSQIGIGSDPYRNLDSVPDLTKQAYAGLVAPKAKSASRLRALIEGLFRIEADVDEFVGSRLTFEREDRTLLGKRHCRLGEDALVGGSVYSVEDKIRVRLFAADLDQYRRFLPTGDLAEPLHDAVFMMIGEELDWDVELALPAGQAKPVRLGGFGQLGWTTWVAPKWTEDDTTMRRDARFHPAERMKQKRRTETVRHQRGEQQTWPTSASKPSLASSIV